MRHIRVPHPAGAFGVQICSCKFVELPTNWFEVRSLVINLLFLKECCEGARCIRCTTVHNHAQLKHAKLPQLIILAGACLNYKSKEYNASHSTATAQKPLCLITPCPHIKESTAKSANISS